MERNSHPPPTPARVQNIPEAEPRKHTDPPPRLLPSVRGGCGCGPAPPPPADPLPADPVPAARPLLAGRGAPRRLSKAGALRSRCRSGRSSPGCVAASTADGVRSREPCIHCLFLCLVLRMELWEFFFFLMYLNCCLSVFTGQRAEGAAASGCSEPDEPDPGVSATVLLLL